MNIMILLISMPRKYGKNPKCKIRSRILGLLGIISPRLVCDLCAFIMKMQNKFGWTFKRIN